MEKNLKRMFLVVGLLTVLEFVFVRGMFTWLICVAATVLVGALNIFVSIKEKDLMQAALYALCVVSLCMGYLVLA